MADKLVEKTEGQYQLTVKGLQFVGTLSLETGRTRQQPKILNAIMCRNDTGEFLWSRWHRQPNKDMVSFPHGMMHYGEAVLAAATRELAEKAALSAELSYRGDVYVRGELDGILDRHMLVHVFEATHAKPLAEAEMIRPEASEPFWASLTTLAPEEFVPGFYEIARLADKAGGEMMFADIIVPV
jgi:8-oxo-dGTP pyrophosphatase MutT (NUDIX family)